jgi:hypothetical protein
MKKFALLMILGLSIAFFGCKKDSDDPDDTNDVFLASTTVQKKVAVLEDFTGVRCGYCPDGHAIAAQLIAANPGKVIVLAVNAGSYAAPQAGYANFTSPFGQALIDQSAVTGYPAGTVNRHKFTGGSYNVQNNGLAMGRSGWTAACNAIMLENAPVNIGAKSTYDAATRKLTIKVDLYYTAAETVQNNINIAFLQSGMVAKQSGGGDNYVHNHVLRTFITGQWGDPVPAASTAKDSKFSKTYTYTVPADFNGAVIPPGGGVVDIDKCDIAIFVTRDRVEILNGLEIKAK